MGGQLHGRSGSSKWRSNSLLAFGPPLAGFDLVEQLADSGAAAASATRIRLA